jgi:hypothetical protein
MDTRTAPNHSMRQLVISVHGIRTFGGWQERLERLLIENGSNYQLTLINYKYGYFSVVAFLIPPLRWLVVRAFRQFLMSFLQEQRWDRIDMVGHSFGTHIIAWALYGLPSNSRPPVNTVIMAGSVLKSNFPWQSLLGYGVERVVNDCGVRDAVLLLSQFLVLFTGMAGRLGFNGGTARFFRNRFFDYGHSGYFLVDGRPDDTFMQRYWVPLLITNADPELVDVRQASALGGIRMTLLNNAEPIKLFVYMAPLVAFALWIGGLYLEADRQRAAAFNNLDDALLGYSAAARSEIERGDPEKASGDLTYMLRLAEPIPPETDPGFALLWSSFAKDFADLGKAFSVKGQLDGAEQSYKISMYILDKLIQLAQKMSRNERWKMLVEGNLKEFGRPGEIFVVTSDTPGVTAIDRWKALLRDVEDQLVNLPSKSRESLRPQR